MEGGDAVRVGGGIGGHGVCERVSRLCTRKGDSDRGGLREVTMGVRVGLGCRTDE